MSEVKITRQQLAQFIKDQRTLRAFELLIGFSNNLPAFPLGEEDGGTGNTTYIIGDMLYASALDVLTKLSGNVSSTMKILSQTGTGSASAAPVWSEIKGTSKQIVVTPGSSDITLSTPQDIDTDSSPTFDDINLTGSVNIGGVQCLSGQATYEPNASAVSSVIVNSGSDHIDRSALNASLSTLVSEINALKDKINSIIAKNKSISIFASS